MLWRIPAGKEVTDGVVVAESQQYRYLFSPSPLPGEPLGTYEELTGYLRGMIFRTLWKDEDGKKHYTPKRDVPADATILKDDIPPVVALE